MKRGREEDWAAHVNRITRGRDAAWAQLTAENRRTGRRYSVEAAVLPREGGGARASVQRVARAGGRAVPRRSPTWEGAARAAREAPPGRPGRRSGPWGMGP